MKREVGLFLIVALLMIGCQKDVDTFIPDPTTPVWATVDGSLGGWVINGDEQVIPGVQLQLGGASAETDYNGVFFWNELKVLDEGEILFASHPSYFPHVKRIQQSDDFSLQMGMSLLERSQAGNIDLNIGGAIDLPQGARINIPPLSLGQSGDMPYQGVADVFAKWVDPTRPELGMYLPGGPYGHDLLGDRKALEIWGMMVVEAETASAETLQLLNNKELALAFPVPATLQSEASATIKLWYLNMETGIWEERGAAQYFNGSYTGSVDKFGYWVCAHDYPVVSFSPILKKSGNEILGSVLWRINFENGISFAEGWTTPEGILEMDVPGDIPFSLTLLSDCGTEVEAMDMGPYSQAPQLAFVSINAPGIYPHKVQASLMDCSGNLIIRGYLKLIRGNETQYIFPDKNGALHTWLSENCPGNSLIAIGVNLEDPLQSIPVERALEAVIDLGMISVCLNADEFITLNLDGESFLGTDPLAYREGNQTFLQDESAGIEFLINGADAGMHDLATNYFIFPTFSHQNTTNPSLSCQVSYYGDPGDFIIGTFGGSFEDMDGTSHTLNGSFKVIRDY